MIVRLKTAHTYCDFRRLWVNYILCFLLLLSGHVWAEKVHDINDVSTVCLYGCDFTELNAAIDATRPGGTVFIKAEVLNTCGLITKPLKIIGEIKGLRRPHLKSKICNGKGALIIEAPDVEIYNLEISDINVPDHNGACIRIGPAGKNVLLKNIYCHDSQNGILANFNNDGKLSVFDSIFERCGFAGRSHGAYIQTDGNVYFYNVKFLSTKGVGHSLKISAKRVLIDGSIIAALNGLNSRAIDNFGGGELVVRNSILQQGPKSDNRDMIGLAFEKGRLQKGKHSVVIENNWIIFDQHTELLGLLTFNRGNLFGGYKIGDINVRNNKIVAMSKINMEGVLLKGNEFFKNRKDAGLLQFDGGLDSFPVLFQKK